MKTFGMGGMCALPLLESKPQRQPHAGLVVLCKSQACLQNPKGNARMGLNGWMDMNVIAALMFNPNQ